MYASNDLRHAFDRKASTIILNLCIFIKLLHNSAKINKKFNTLHTIPNNPIYVVYYEKNEQLPL